MRLGKAALTLILATLCALPAVAVQRTFVSGQGLDTNPCTVSQPCRSFAMALTALSPNGEVVAVDSAGYGTLNVTQAATIVAPLGVHAGISASVGDAVTVNLAGAGAVNLRNLYINSQGAVNGITFTNGSELSIEHCVVSGFSSYDIQLSLSVNATVRIMDSIVKDSAGTGIYANCANPNHLTVSIDRSHIDGNLNGILVEVAVVSISNSTVDSNYNGVGVAGAFALVGIESSVLSNNIAFGVYEQAANASVVIHNSMLFNNVSGVYAYGNLLVDHSAVAESTYGLETNGAVMTVSNSSISDCSNAGIGSLTSYVTLSGCTIARNGTGVLTDAPTIVYTASDNVFTGNFSDVSPGPMTPLAKK